MSLRMRQKYALRASIQKRQYRMPMIQKLGKIFGKHSSLEPKQKIIMLLGKE